MVAMAPPPWLQLQSVSPHWPSVDVTARYVGAGDCSGRCGRRGARASATPVLCVAVCRCTPLPCPAARRRSAGPRRVTRVPGSRCVRRDAQGQERATIGRHPRSEVADACCSRRVLRAAAAACARQCACVC